MIDNVMQLVTYYICLWEFWRITFSTDISRWGGSALYRDSKEQYNADCLARSLAQQLVASATVDRQPAAIITVLAESLVSRRDWSSNLVLSCLGNRPTSEGVSRRWVPAAPRYKHGCWLRWASEFLKTSSELLSIKSAEQLFHSLIVHIGRNMRTSRIWAVYTIQPVVKPVVQLLWQPVVIPIVQPVWQASVSYTHLTLPTILRV